MCDVTHLIRMGGGDTLMGGKWMQGGKAGSMGGKRGEGREAGFAFAKLQYVSSGFRCRVITGLLMRLY